MTKKGDIKGKGKYKGTAASDYFQSSPKNTARKKKKKSTVKVDTSAKSVVKSKRLKNVKYKKPKLKAVPKKKKR